MNNLTVSTTTPSLSITWQQSTFILPVFCLCPLLAASNSLAVAIGLSAVMLWLTTISTIANLIVRSILPPSMVSIGVLFTSSTLVAITELGLHAWHYELFRRLDMFLPLCVIACVLMCRSEMHTTSVRELGIRTIKTNAGFSFAAIVLGTGREIVGHGTLLSDADKIFGATWERASITLFPTEMGFLLGILAPGAFIGFGMGVALYNWLWLHRPHKT